MTKYIAFHNDPALQSRMLAAVDAHVKHDQVVQATYGSGSGEQFRGCFIGCTIHALDGDSAGKFEDVDRVFDAYGFPPILTHLCEEIFEGLPSDDAPAFFKAVPNALNLGADLSLVVWKFLHWMVLDTLEKHGTHETRRGCAAAVTVLLDRANGLNVTPNHAASYAAHSAGYAAASYATRAAAHSAGHAAAASYAAHSAGYAAASYATRAAAAAADVTVLLDRANGLNVTPNRAAAAAAAAAAYQRFAAKLAELIGEAK